MTVFLLYTACLIIGCLLVSGILFEHKRVLTYLSVSVALFMSCWLALSMISRAIHSDMATLYVFGLGSLSMLLFGFLFRGSLSLPWRTPASGIRDAIALLTMAPVLFSVSLIAGANGFQADGSYALHGFYNGDVTTFVSLVQKSFFVNDLVAENPFAGGETLEYPSVLHGAVADFFMKVVGVTHDFIYYLPTATFVVSIATVGMLWLLLDIAWPLTASGDSWLGEKTGFLTHIIQAGLIFAVLLLSWDLFVYPQSHFFLTAPLILLVALLGTTQTHKLPMRVFFLGAIHVLAFALLVSNAVTGTAGWIALITWYVLLVFNNKQALSLRGFALFAILLLLAVFSMLSSGDSALGGSIHFSSSAGLDAMKLAPLAILVAIGAMTQWGAQTYLSALAVMLLLGGTLVFFFSDRAIVIANASRFYYLALLSTFPLLAPLCLRVFYWWRREAFFTTHTLFAKLSMVFLGGYVLFMTMLLPGASGVALTHFHLLKNDFHSVDLANRVALDWVASNTSADAVFYEDPFSPWTIPFFTGRSILRASDGESAYWLSRDDALLEKSIRASEGDTSSASDIASVVNYVYTSKKSSDTWSALGLEKVYDNGEVIVFAGGLN